MEVRTVGVEEEFLLVDPESGRVVDGAEAVLRAVRDSDAAQAELDVVDRELLRSMLEIRTEPSTDVADLGRQLAATRRRLGSAAADTGGALVASGTAPFAQHTVAVAPQERYREWSTNSAPSAGRPAPAACTSTSRWSPARRASAPSTGSAPGCPSCWR